MTSSGWGKHKEEVLWKKRWSLSFLFWKHWLYIDILHHVRLKIHMITVLCELPLMHWCITVTQKYPVKKQWFYLWYPYICIHILWNILTFKILDIMNTNIPKSMNIVIYVQDNRTFPKLFLHSYVTLSDPGTAQLINMAYFIHLCPSPYPELKCIRITAT